MAESAVATFAAGCFWGVEEEFRTMPGVTGTRVGYVGGSTPSPTYERVCAGGTGHAEAVEVEYDPETVTYAQLLARFWEIHDPTTRNRQGPDVGNQYRSAIFVHDAAQRAAAESSLRDLDASGRHRHPVVTVIAPATTFWQAEEYHQQYLLKRGQAACRLR